MLWAWWHLCHVWYWFYFPTTAFYTVYSSAPSHVLLDACDFQYSVGWDVAWYKLWKGDLQWTVVLIQFTRCLIIANDRTHADNAVLATLRVWSPSTENTTGSSVLNAWIVTCPAASTTSTRTGPAAVLFVLTVWSSATDSCTHWLNRNLHNDGCSGSIVCADRNRLDLPAQQTATTMPFSLAGCIFFLVNVVSCQSNRLTFHLQHIICLLYIAFDTFTAPMFLQCLCNRCTINSYNDDDGDQQ